MKSSLLKDTFREISNTLGRFLSIFAIVALGVGFFAGIKATAPDMKITADKYFDDYGLMDFWLISTLGFNEKDIEEISKLENIEGIAPSYSMDAIFEDEDNEKVVKYLDIPLQHVSNQILKKMNRKTTKEDIINLIVKLRTEIPNIVIRTTFIVGFPGEEKTHFEELYDFIKEIRFDRVGVFTYSREEGTPAYDFANQVDEDMKEDRRNLIRRTYD